MSKAAAAAFREEDCEFPAETEEFHGSNSQPGSTSMAPFQKKPRREDHPMTKKVSLSSDGSHPVTIGTGLPDK